MSKFLNYRAPDRLSDKDSKLALYYRSIKKICRDCHAKLAIDTEKCTKCHSKDLRLKHKIRKYNGSYLDGFGLNSMRVINLNEFRRNYKIK